MSQKRNDFQPRGMVVKVINNNVDAAISQLKRKINDDGMKKELRDREHFVSKGQKRRKAKAAGIARYRKALAEQGKGR